MSPPQRKTFRAYLQGLSPRYAELSGRQQRMGKIMIHDLEEGGIDAQAFFLGRKEAILIYLKGEGGKGVGGRGGGLGFRARSLAS